MTQHIAIELTPEVEKAIDAWRAQARQELDWFYAGGSDDAKFVADTLAEALSNAQAVAGE